MNENCLKGIACPICSSEGPFDITAVSTFVMYDMGSEGHGDIEYDENARCRCRKCGNIGAVKDFTFKTAKPWLQKMLDVSTEHLSNEDEVILDQRSQARPKDGFPRVTKHEMGWVMFLTGDYGGQQVEIDYAEMLGCSAGLVAILELAHKENALILNFDADATVIPGITKPPALKVPPLVNDEESTTRFRNHYQHCGTEWTEEWSCACNDRCPVCNREIEPAESEEIIV